MSCVVSMQYGNSLDACLVLGAVAPQDIAIISWKQSSRVTKRTNQEVKVRKLESFCSETMSNLAKIRYEWCGVAEHDTALEWCRDEAQIEVEKVQWPPPWVSCPKRCKMPGGLRNAGR